jgi:hypothetical protein
MQHTPLIHQLSLLLQDMPLLQLMALFQLQGLLLIQMQHMQVMTLQHTPHIMTNQVTITLSKITMDMTIQLQRLLLLRLQLLLHHHLKEDITRILDLEEEPITEIETVETAETTIEEETLVQVAVTRKLSITDHQETEDIIHIVKFQNIQTFCAGNKLFIPIYFTLALITCSASQSPQLQF